MATFTQLISDTFQRADEAPLNPANWNSIGGVLPTVDELQIVSDLATTTVQVQADGQATYIDDSLPANQYVEVQTVRQAFNGVFVLYLRASAPLAPSYALTIGGQYGISPPDPNLCSFLVGELGSINNYRWTSDLGVGITLNSGDVITFAVSGGVGGHLYVFKNRVQIAQYNLDDSVTNVPVPGASGNSALPIISSTGRVGMQLASLSTPATIDDIGIKNFAAGSFASAINGTVISCAPRPEPNRWEVIYTYPLEAGGL